MYPQYVYANNNQVGAVLRQSALTKGKKSVQPNPITCIPALSHKAFQNVLHSQKWERGERQKQGWASAWVGMANDCLVLYIPKKLLSNNVTGIILRFRHIIQHTIKAIIGVGLHLLGDCNRRFFCCIKVYFRLCYRKILPPHRIVF